MSMIWAGLPRPRIPQTFLSGLLCALFLFRLWFATALPMTGDEAYFVLWGEHPAGGYYDHPPMVGWWLSALLTLSRAEWVLRLPALLLPLLLAGAVWQMLRAQSVERARVAALLVLLAPLNVWNVLITTDTPVILFTLFSALAYLTAQRQKNLSGILFWHALAGALLGLAFLGKYFAALLGVAYLAHTLCARRLALIPIRIRTDTLSTAPCRATALSATFFRVSSLMRIGIKQNRVGIRVMTMESFNVLEVSGLSKRVGEGDEGGKGHDAALTILHEISFSVAAGQTVAIVGASGSGKSTLLGLLAGLDRPSSGSVVLAGESLTALDEDACAILRGRLLGFVFQSFQLLPSLTALENVMLPLELAGVAQARTEAEYWLARVGLAHRLQHYPKHLSGGEQQRVALARAFAPNPKLILADEPTGNLDAATGQQIIELMFAMNAERATTLILVTHDEAIATRCGRRLRMNAGCLEEM